MAAMVATVAVLWSGQMNLWPACENSDKKDFTELRMAGMAGVIRSMAETVET